MDPEAVFTGLKNAADVIPGLNCFDFAPDAIAPPSFFPFELEIDYDQTFGGGMEAYLVTCRLLVSRASDRAGQKKLQAYLPPTGPRSVKAALEATRTPAAGALGGVCDDLHVRRVSGYGLYEHPLGSFYLGAEWTVFIIGRGN